MWHKRENKNTTITYNKGRDNNTHTYVTRRAAFSNLQQKFNRLNVH